MRLRQSLGITFTAVILLLCGCGNSGSSANPPKGLSYSAGSVVYTKGVAITPDNPASSGGAVSSYSVSPALPAGLTLNSTTGVISGTPTAVSPMASYTVTASDLDGSTTTTLSITVNDQPPTALSYGAGTSTYTINTPITPNAPASSGGTVISYSVNPALPAGLSLSTTTGVISGTPAMLAGAVAYTVTATNSGGSATASVTIAVNSGAAPPLAAPAGLAYHPAAAVYTMGVQIPENAPTSTGGPPLSYKLPDGTPVPAYSIFPDLPLGLRLSGSPVTLADNGTGVISGTPLVTSGPITYTVTASNPAGSTTAPLTITVNAAGTSPSGLAYGTPAPVYVAGMAIASNAPLTNPTIPTGSVYSVSPDLPAGLSIDAGSGAISGTPLAVSSAIVPTPPSTTYHTVTATTAAGSTSAPLTITIYDKPQGIPNMAQWITPLETTGASFQYLDTGMVVTDSLNPQILPKEWLAGQAVSTSISPDGNTLLVLTSGFNRVYQGPFPLFDPLYSSEYIFIFDITNHTPVFTQAVRVPNAYHGIVWDPVTANHAFYVSGGMGDAPFGTDPIPYPLANNGDNIHIVQQQGDGTWQSVAELGLGQSPSTPSQGHPSGNGLPVPNNQFASVNSAVFVAPMAAGLTISPDGRTLVVANYFNDSITVFTGGLDIWKAQWVQDADSAQGFQGLLPGTELDLRPGKAASGATPGTPGGEYPFWVVFKGDSGPSATVYVSSLREREIDVVPLGETCAHGTTGPNCLLAVAPTVSVRIPVKGQPNKMTLNSAQTLLYVAEDESDTVDVIDLNPQDVGSPYQNQPGTVNTVIESIPVIAPPGDIALYSLAPYTGANTNSVTLSPDESLLYVTNGNLNNIAVVQLTKTNHGDKVVGLIPTGWYPNSVSFSKDGIWAYVANMKSPTGPNPDECYAYGPSSYPTCMPAGEYNPQLTKAGLLSFPVPSVAGQLPALTTKVEANNHFATPAATDPTLAAVHQGIQHVIYILKENRTYDQILGDLGRGNGDPSLTLFGQEITPNQHNLAQMFVTLDNFRDTAEVSYDGWPWSTSARAPDIVEHQYPVNYAQRGLALEGEGNNRSVNVALPTLAQRQASNPLMPGGALSPNVTGGEDLLPGQTNVDAPDGPNNELNTGYLWDNALRAGLTVRDYGFFIDTTCYNEPACQTPLAHDPFSTNTVVAPSTSVSLTPYTDPYFRGFDPSFPDYYRFKEWEREFDTNYAAGGLPNLTLVRFMHDHTGNFGTAIDGVNTPDRDVADNDYAVGLLVQKIANSPVYKNNTLIFVVEDDAQDGGDHVDSHRSTAYVVGAYVKNGVVSKAYNTLDFVRTMEEVMGLPPMNLNDALATPMTDIFNTNPLPWSFTAVPPAILYCTKLPLPLPAQPCTNPTPNVAYWTRVTKGMDFSDADLVDGGQFNHILWKGLMGNRPYPSRPSGKDLRQNREKLLAHYRRSLGKKAAPIARPAGD
ncbi:MAG: putative Ig domain-containing protein [Terriglobia bacterium]|nr:putative Ig domain-containing protein [Terriglobia bacterium]